MPDTIAELCQVIESADSQSSLLKKAGLPLRRRLVDALIRREPYTYREVFDHFGLASLGISFTAFYYWSRKVRRTAALIEMARSCSPDENPVELLPQVLAHRLLDASLDEDIDLSALNRLAQIYHMTSYVDFARRRVNHQFGSSKKPLGAPAVSRSQISNPEIPNPPSPPATNPVNPVHSPPSIPHSEFRIPTSPNLVNPVNPVHSSDAESADDLLALSDRALAREQARLAEDEARALARFEQAKKDLTAMGYPVAHCKTHDEVEEILRTHEPTVAAAVSAADERRAIDSPLAADSAPSPSSSVSEISNPQISNPASLPASNLVNLVNPVHSPPSIPHSPPIPNLCSSASSADNPSASLIPLATMRRNLPNPAVERARLDPLALSDPNPVNRVADPPGRINPAHSPPSIPHSDFRIPTSRDPVHSSVGAIDESPDSHGPGELPKLPLIKQDFPDPDPTREALRLRVRAAYGLKELPRVNNWIDPALIAEYDISPNAPDDQLSEDQLRRRDLRRCLLAFGVLKEPATAPDSS